MMHRPSVFVHLLPALVPPGSLEGGVAVVLDVLRATTVMIHALAAGCDAIFPCAEVEEARALAATFPKGVAVLAGERHGEPIADFDLGNSPGDFTSAACSGKTVVMTTTNGTRAILASLAADRVLVAGFVNWKATVEVLKADGRPIHLICAGTDGQVSLEDTMLAGALADDLDSWAWDFADDEADLLKLGDAPIDTILANDSAEIAAALWHETTALKDEGYPLSDSLSDGRGGRRNLELGNDADIEDASRVDRFPFAAELLRDPLRIVPATDAAGPRLRLFGAS